MVESDLEKLKKEYSILQKKYDLPSFEILNKDFSIEKIADTETDLLLREIRRYLGESVEGLLRFLEGILNPASVPMYLFPLIKSLDDKNKKALSDLHKKLAKLQICSLILVDYSEEKEVNYIKDTSALWQEIKKDFVEIIKEVESRLEYKSEKKKGGYFG